MNVKDKRPRTRMRYPGKLENELKDQDGIMGSNNVKGP